MERDVLLRGYLPPVGNFNSHAHVERDLGVMRQRYGAMISTHTLTWSVTQNTSAIQLSHSISTHTLTWSVTFQNYCTHVQVYISTHTLTWSVTGAKLDDNAIIGISTHTLTWSVTQYEEITGEKYEFQLTRSRGA